MTKDGFFPTRHFVWSNGYAAKFKGASAWFHVARYPSLIVYPKISRGCFMNRISGIWAMEKDSMMALELAQREVCKKKQLKVDGAKV